MLFWVVLYGIYYHRAFFESIILHHAPFKFCRLLQVMFLFQNVYKLAVLLLVLYAIKCFDIEKNDSYKNFSKVMDKANDILKENDKTSLTDDDKALINSMLPDYDKYPSVAKLQAVEIAKSSSKMATLLMLDERYNETVSEALES